MCESIYRHEIGNKLERWSIYKATGAVLLDDEVIEGSGMGSAVRKMSTPSANSMGVTKGGTPSRIVHMVLSFCRCF